MTDVPQTAVAATRRMTCCGEAQTQRCRLGRSQDVRSQSLTCLHRNDEPSLAMHALKKSVHLTLVTGYTSTAPSRLMLHSGRCPNTISKAGPSLAALILCLPV